MEVKAHIVMVNAYVLWLLYYQIGKDHLASYIKSQLIHLIFSDLNDWHEIESFRKNQLYSMISIDDFRTASFERKCDVVMADTTYITSRKLGGAEVYLYHSGKFFIEVYYSPTYKKVLMINAFDDSYGLEPYAEMVSLVDLGL